MRIKNVFPVLVLATVFSSSVFAGAPDTGFYVGADASVLNKTKLKFSSHDGLEPFNIFAKNKFAGDLVLGWQQNQNNGLILAVEAEYRNLGQAKFVEEGETILKSNINALFVNFKPKFALDNGAYIAALAGAGAARIKFDAPFADEGPKSKTKAAYQFGAEVGYPIVDNLIADVGYRYTMTKFYEAKISSHGPYVGIRYHF